MNPDRGNENLEDRLRRELASHDELVFAYLFGSRAAGTARATSDVDVAVHLSEPPDLELRGVLRAAVERAAGSEDVDLVVLNEAPPLLAERILRTGTVLLSRSEPERVHWMVHTKSRYCDLAPLRRRLDRTVSERLGAGTFGTQKRRRASKSGAFDGPGGSDERS